MERMCNWSELHVTPAHSQGVGSECRQFSRLPQGSCRCIPNSSKACPEISWPVPTKCFPNRKQKKRKNNTMIRSKCPVIGRHQPASENFLSGQHIARSSIMNVQWFLLYWAARKQMIRRSSAAGHTPSSLRASLGWAPREEHNSSTFRKKMSLLEMMIHICRPCIWRQEYAAMNILTVGVLMITACFQYEASDQLQRIGPKEYNSSAACGSTQKPDLEHVLGTIRRSSSSCSSCSAAATVVAPGSVRQLSKQDPANPFSTSYTIYCSCTSSY